MITAWIFILLCVSCSVWVAHLLKQVEVRRLDTVRVLTVNYAAAFLTASLVHLFRYRQLPSGLSEIPVPLMILALLIGLIFISNYFLYSKSVHRNGVGISIASMRMSLVFPVLISVLWYGDPLTGTQWVGIGLVFPALMLLLPETKTLFKGAFTSGWMLLLLFLLTGIGDLSLKIYEVEYSTLLADELFIAGVFAAALLAGTFFLLIRGGLAPNRQELQIGITIGIPNFLTILFLIEALHRLSGGVVYSAVNLLTVLGGTLIGVTIWKDQIKNHQWVAIFLALLSILFLLM
ncbi:MAG: EamA family transporter [Balneolaceae bacterium]